MPQTILIAEDDMFLLKVYKVKMEKVGIEALIARDGEEVFSLLQGLGGQKPALILLDIIMPKKDGFIVLKELREHPEYASIPVIITSNLGQPEDKTKALEMGALDYIVKSDISIQGIVDRVMTVIGPSA